MDEQYLSTLAFQLGAYLSRSGCTVTTAESCTGGWIAKVLTDIPGSSAWFGQGLVTYSNQAKTSALAVGEQLLATYGAVSEPVVEAMAKGALAAAQADYSVAVSGIAGPDGGTAEKPVGTVCFGWARTDKANGVAVRSQTCQLEGDRAEVRLQSVAIAIEGLIELME